MKKVNSVRTAGLGRRSSGFSLIEVVIAIGIVASVLVALLGLFGLGMDTMREAINEQVEARIMQSVNSDLQASDFDRLQDMESEQYFFDEEGTRVRSGRDAVYAAKIELLDQSGSGVKLPGMDRNSMLIRANVKIGRFLGGNTNNSFKREMEGKTWNQFTTLIADLRPLRMRAGGPRPR